MRCVGDTVRQERRLVRHQRHFPPIRPSAIAVPLVVGKRAVTMSDLPAVPLDGAHRLRRFGVTRRSEAEVQAERKRVDGGGQDSVTHIYRMLGPRRLSERDRHSGRTERAWPAQGGWGVCPVTFVTLLNQTR